MIIESTWIVIENKIGEGSPLLTLTFWNAILGIATCIITIMDKVGHILIIILNNLINNTVQLPRLRIHRISILIKLQEKQNINCICNDHAYRYSLRLIDVSSFLRVRFNNWLRLWLMRYCFYLNGKVNYRNLSWKWQ